MRENEQLLVDLVPLTSLTLSRGNDLKFRSVSLPFTLYDHLNLTHCFPSSQIEQLKNWSVPPLSPPFFPTLSH